MKLSEHFTLEELCKSNTARRLGINNVPDEEGIAKLRLLCNTVLEPIREAYGRPIIISSGYRSPKLNKAIKGATKSQHMSCEAADIHSITDTPADNKELHDLIKDMIDKGIIVVGQLIDEYDYNWVHVSLPTPKLKNQVLKIK